MKRKRLEDLTLQDDFMFKAVMQNPELCRKMLEIILNLRVRKICYVEEERELMSAYTSKGIRLDVFVEDDQNTVYNIEMQTSMRDDLRRRSRYYQANMDIEQMKKGMDYARLGNCFVIFICAFDPFGLDRPVYTFRNICKEAPDLGLGDGGSRLFLNTKAARKAESRELRDFLLYLEDGLQREDACDYIRCLAEEITRIQRSEKWRMSYMTWELQLLDERKEGRREGRKEGRKEGKLQGMETATLASIRSLIKTMGLTEKQAMDALQIPEEDQKRYRELLEQPAEVEVR